MNQKIETLTGLIVVAMAVIFLGYGLGQNDIGIADDYYPLTASFENISGIQSGTDVKVSGVKVGTVADTKLDNESFQADVTLMIKQGLSFPIDSSVKIASDGLLGGSHIVIEPGADDATLAAGERFDYSQSSVSIMDLLGRAVFSAGAGNDE
ncbi:MAG: outer membrane lipid asymmetry maintenance protein MlaD [Pseudomonadota bacterium]